jgi:uncharacterized protein (DUF2344 family)
MISSTELRIIEEAVSTAWFLDEKTDSINSKVVLFVYKNELEFTILTQFQEINPEDAITVETIYSNQILNQQYIVDSVCSVLEKLKKKELKEYNKQTFDVYLHKNNN